MGISTRGRGGFAVPRETSCGSPLRSLAFHKKNVGNSLDLCESVQPNGSPVCGAQRGSEYGALFWERWRGGWPRGKSCGPRAPKRGE
jgi:hypothetical protein